MGRCMHRNREVTGMCGAYTTIWCKTCGARATELFTGERLKWIYPKRTNARLAARASSASGTGGTSRGSSASRSTSPCQRLNMAATVNKETFE